VPDSFRIIALDPGGTTGWATFTARRVVVSKNCRFADEKWSCGQLGPQEHHNVLDQFLANQQIQETVVVCESFMHYRDRNPVDLISVEYIGVVKRLCQAKGIRLVFQSSSQGKIGPNSFVRKSNLDTLGLWLPGRTHAMDAYGHLLHFMIYSKGVPIIKRNELLRAGWK
jgi:hypothetical protein